MEVTLTEFRKILGGIIGSRARIKSSDIRTREVGGRNQGRDIIHLGVIRA